MASACQLASCATWAAVTRRPSQLRSTDSSTMRSETGSRLTRGYLFASAGSEYKTALSPLRVLKLWRVDSNFCSMVVARLTSIGTFCQPAQSPCWRCLISVTRPGENRIGHQKEIAEADGVRCQCFVNYQLRGVARHDLAVDALRPK